MISSGTVFRSVMVSRRPRPWIRKLPDPNHHSRPPGRPVAAATPRPRVNARMRYSSPSTGTVRSGSMRRDRCNLRESTALDPGAREQRISGVPESNETIPATLSRFCGSRVRNPGWNLHTTSPRKRPIGGAAKRGRTSSGRTAARSTGCGTLLRSRLVRPIGTSSAHARRRRNGDQAGTMPNWSQHASQVAGNRANGSLRRVSRSHRR